MGISQKNEQRPLNNVFLIGTKIDNCYDNIPLGKPHNQRKVPKERALELCKKMNLAGCAETSNQYIARWGNQDTEDFFEITSDCFSHAACFCVDQTSHELRMEYSLTPDLGNSRINNTHLIQSENSVVQRGRAKQNDSFYSFSLGGGH